VHAFLHEAAVVVLHVVHVVRWRRGLLLLRGEGGEGKDCEAGAKERDWQCESQIVWRFENVHDGTSLTERDSVATFL